jgi:hypothetical protein
MRGLTPSISAAVGLTGLDGAIAESNAAEGIPRGNIRGRDPLAGGTRTGCSITPRTSHVPAGPAARVISRK